MDYDDPFFDFARHPDYPPAPTAPWWAAAKLRWLLAAPALALVVVILIGQEIRWAGGQVMATWWADRAEQSFSEDDYPAALEQIDEALRWLPGQPQLYFVRAQIREADQDLYGALADYDLVIEYAPKLARAYSARGELHRRLGLYREAIDDLTRVIELRPASDPLPLNHRAYARALAGIELPQALSDVEKAIALTDQPDAALLDTRGYIHYLLGDIKSAQANIDQAIAQAERETEQFLESQHLESLSPPERERVEKVLKENLAVMYHHRGLIHQRLGHDDLARRDQELAARHGYNPFLGVE